VNAPGFLPPFAADEFEDRLAGLREAMELHGLDACVLTSPWNIAYFAGLLPAPLAAEPALVVTMERSVILSPVRGAARAAGGFGEVLAHDGTRDGLWRAAAEVAGTGRAIGCEADHLTLMQSEKLNAHLRPKRGLDIALAAMQQRMVKSDAELALIRAGAGIASSGLQAMRAALAPGRTEAEIAEAGRAAMLADLARALPPDMPAEVLALVQSGPNSRAGGLGPTRRPVKPGEPVGLTAAPVLGFWPLALKDTVFPGDTPPAAAPALAALAALLDRLPELALPGATCGGIAAALAEAGRDLVPGADWAPDYGGGLPGEPLLALRPGNETVLEPGMVLALAPRFQLPEGRAGAGGYGTGALFLVTETGAERL
jgi:creatinase